jgi:hypothetical protein
MFQGFGKTKAAREADLNVVSNNLVSNLIANPKATVLNLSKDRQ